MEQRIYRLHNTYIIIMTFQELKYYYLWLAKNDIVYTKKRFAKSFIQFLWLILIKKYTLHPLIYHQKVLVGILIARNYSKKGFTPILLEHLSINYGVPLTDELKISLLSNINLIKTYYERLDKPIMLGNLYDRDYAFAIKFLSFQKLTNSPLSIIFKLRIPKINVMLSLTD